MFESENINQRILRKFSIFELSLILFVLLLAIYFLLTKSGLFWDYKVYLATAGGDFENYFYGYWLLPLFKILSFLPFEVNYSIWILLSVIGVVFAVRVFNGNLPLALISYQMSFSLFWGQISGIICGFLGLFWWSLHQKKWWLAGFALLIVAAKPHTGGMFAFLLWIFAEIKWKDKLRVLIIPIVGVIISLVVYPGWIMDVIARSGNAYAWGNISLYQWIGPWALLLFLPALIVPMQKQHRFLLLAVTGILTIPYFLQTDLITLFLFPVGWIPVMLGYLPAIMPFFLGYEGQHTGFLVPFFIYISILTTQLIILGKFVKSKKPT
jgi:hypothetical protein